MKINFWISFTAILLLLSCSVKEKEPEKKIVYIDNTKLYNEFKLTQELQTKLTEEFRVKKNSLDSLEMEVLSHAKLLQQSKNISQSEIQKFQLKKEDFLLRKQKLEEEQVQLTEQYNSQILNQINQYIKEFGDENKIDLIVGSNGDGNVMYGSSELDMTDEAISYLNSKYNPVK
jgi:outer membrane protein